MILLMILSNSQFRTIVNLFFTASWFSFISSLRFWHCRPLADRDVLHSPSLASSLSFTCVHWLFIIFFKKEKKIPFFYLYLYSSVSKYCGVLVCFVLYEITHTCFILTVHDKCTVTLSQYFCLCNSSERLLFSVWLQKASLTEGERESERDLKRETNLKRKLSYRKCFWLWKGAQCRHICHCSRVCVEALPWKRDHASQTCNHSPIVSVLNRETYLILFTMFRLLDLLRLFIFCPCTAFSQIKASVANPITWDTMKDVRGETVKEVTIRNMDQDIYNIMSSMLK